MLGVLPALLVVWVLVSLKESERWQQEKSRNPEEAKQKRGSLRELLGVAKWRNRALIGMGLAAVGLGTYWAIYAWGVELVGEVLKVMHDLAAEGRTMVVVTHEMGFAREVSNKVLFLHQGQIEEENTPQELFNNPKSDRCREFLSSII